MKNEKEKKLRENNYIFFKDLKFLIFFINNTINSFFFIHNKYLIEFLKYKKFLNP
jgi:hypothetical protein